MAITASICEYGRARWQTRGMPGFRAQFPHRAPLKYLPAGLYYLGRDLLAEQLNFTGFSNRPRFSPASVLSAPTHRTPPAAPQPANMVFAVTRGESPSSDGRTPIDRANLYRIVLVLAGEKTFFTAEELALETEKEHRFHVPLTRVNALLEQLINDGDIKRIGDRYFCLSTTDEKRETSALTKACERSNRAFRDFKDAVDAKIRQVPTGHDLDALWETIHEDRSRLGIQGMHLFLLESDGRLRKVKGTSTRERSYREPQPPTGVMKAVLVSSEILHRVEIGENFEAAMAAFRAAGFSEVNESWVRESLLANHIGSIDLIKLTDESGRAIGVLLLRNPVYFGRGNQPEVDRRLVDFAKAISTAARKFVATAAPSPPAPRVNSTFPYSDSSRVSTYHGLRVEANYTPARHFAGEIEERIITDAAAIVKVCTGSDPTADEMRAHVVQVNKVEFVWDGDRPVAFGSLDITDNYSGANGQKEPLFNLVGMMVLPEYRRRGLMIKLTDDLLRVGIREGRSIRERGGFIRRLFSPSRILIRTQSRAVYEACQKFFKGVKPVGVKPALRHQRIVDFAAGKNSWSLDASNVQRNVYESRRTDSRDIIPGLGERDAYVFSADFTLWLEIKMWFYVSFIYPLVRPQSKKTKA